MYPVTVNVLPTSDPLLHRRQVLLLHQLATAPNGSLRQSEANKTIPKQIQTELGLPGKMANELRGRMIADGWLAEEKLKRVVTYSITDAGRHRLRELEQFLPLQPAMGPSTCRPTTAPAWPARCSSWTRSPAPTVRR